VLALAWSPDGRKLLSGGEDRRLLVRLVSDGKVEATASAGMGPVHGAAWSRDNRLWAGATWGGTTYVGKAANNQMTQHRQGGLAAGVDTIAFSPDCTMLAAASNKGLVLWGVIEDRFRVLRQRDIATTEPLTGVAIAPGNGLVAAGGTDGLVRLFELTGDKEKATLKGHAGEVRCVAISPDGKVVVSGGGDGAVKVWDAEGNKESRSLGKPQGVVLSVAMACDGKLVAAGGLDGAVRLWDATTGKDLAESAADPTAPVYALAFSPDGKTLAVAAGREVRRYDTSALVGTAIPVKPPPSVEKIEPPVVPPPDKGKGGEMVARTLPFQSAAVDVKGGYALVANRLGVVRRFSYPDFKGTGQFTLERLVYRIALDVPGKTLYLVKASRTFQGANGWMRGEDPELLAYDLDKLVGEPDKVEPRDRMKLEGTISGLALAPDGKHLYYLDSKGNKLCRVDPKGRKVERTVDVAGAKAMCLTPDGKTIWVVSSEDAKTGKLQRLEAPGLDLKGSHALDFAPLEVVATDDGMVAVSGGVGTVRLARLLDAEKDFRQQSERRGTDWLALALSPDQKVVFVSPRRPPPVQIQRWSTGRQMPKAIPLLTISGKGKTPVGELILSPDGQFMLFPRAGIVLRMPR
jgi:sugar lactone lactonase YvrE